MGTWGTLVFAVRFHCFEWRANRPKRMLMCTEPRWEIMRGWMLVVACSILLAPGATACSFIAEADGGTSVRVHDIRTGQFGFSGPTEFTFLMGNGDGWTSPVYEGGQHPAFSYDYGAAGTYVIEVHCHDLESDTWEEATPTQVTVGGLLGLPSWMWGVVLAAALVVVVLARARVLARRRAAGEAASLLQPARARNLSTNQPRRSMGCFPRPGEEPRPLPSGIGHRYTATLPAGHSPTMHGLELAREDTMLHLDWWPPELPPDAFLTGFRLFEQRDGKAWVHRENLPPEVNGVDIDHSDAEDGPHRITGYEVRPVFEMGAGRPHDAQGAKVTL